MVHYFPNGVDTDRFAPGPGRSKPNPRATDLGVTPDEIVVGTVGMLRPDKNHARLIRAFHAVTRQCAARLVIVGGRFMSSRTRPARQRARHCRPVCSHRRPSSTLGAVLSSLRRLRAVVGHRADAALGSRSDGFRSSGGEHRRRRRGRDDRAATRAGSSARVATTGRSRNTWLPCCHDAARRRQAGARESRAGAGTLQPVANDRVLSTAVPLAAHRERTGGLSMCGICGAFALEATLPP